MIHTVLCIGASTYSPNTPKQINDALSSSRFLEKGSVILAFHKYFAFYPQGLMMKYDSNFFGDDQLKELKDRIKNQDFPDCNVVFIEKIGLYKIETGDIYILPDSYSTNNFEIPNSSFPQLQSCIEEVDNDLIINCFAEKTADDPDYTECYKDYPIPTDYYPCIDAIMKQFSRTNTANQIGLILAGMGKDGAEGLTSIGKNGGKIAIQNPYEYQPELDSCTDFSTGEEVKRSSRDMPNAAILEAQKANISHDIISLYRNTNNKSLLSTGQEILNCIKKSLEALYSKYFGNFSQRPFAVRVLSCTKKGLTQWLQENIS